MNGERNESLFKFKEINWKISRDNWKRKKIEIENKNNKMRVNCEITK